ncbi:hypothetical protein Taro_049576 [Colocasia esculenta]|uniref:Uncharacterized protein n=1 Tax=Colocasia esculenta TaxID=4460 RepID=A0A843XBH1_COLES|nr:hypothetical protein [Colocasia esculenta]
METSKVNLCILLTMKMRVILQERFLHIADDEDEAVEGVDIVVEGEAAATVPSKEEECCYRGSDVDRTPQITHFFFGAKYPAPLTATPHTNTDMVLATLPVPVLFLSFNWARMMQPIVASHNE